MGIKKYLFLLWVPLMLSLTATVTYFNSKSAFDTLIFVQALLITTGHFYLTHFLAGLFFSIHGSTKWEYWKAASFSYIPFMLAFWGLHVFVDAAQSISDSTIWGILIGGMLLSAILFTILCIKKVKMDLDAVLALILIIAVAGTVTAAVFTFLVARLFSMS